MERTHLEMRGITKEFPGVRALDNVNFSVRKGEIHALVGENGAGKSTLMKILSGVYPHGTYDGQILVSGTEQRYRGIRDSEHARIAIIYQELALVQQMSIAENIFLGCEFERGGVIDRERAVMETGRLLKEVGLNTPPDTLVRELGVGEQQLVEIAKALSKNAEILILDEPTAALTEGESANLLSIISRLRDKGVTCVYISHRLKEVFSLCDRITVLRDGKTIRTEDASALNEESLITLMVGRELTSQYPYINRQTGQDILTVKNWTVKDRDTGQPIIDNASFSLKQGEILGFAGLIGAGRTELFLSLFGAYDHPYSGSAVLNGQPFFPVSPRHSIESGLSYLSEDRKKYGLVLDMDIRRNTSLASLENLSIFGMINENEEIVLANRAVKDLRIKTPSIEQKTGNLSGGNQQKVVLAKWLATEPAVLVVDEPTRGIDVGARFEIYNILNSLTGKGVSIILISSDLPEVLGMSDRVMVMHEGRITGELSHSEASQEKVMFYATGGH